MANSGLKTDSVLPGWRGVCSSKDTSVSENSFREVLDWAIRHGFLPNSETALDFGRWQELRSALFCEFPSGDWSVPELLRAWQGLFKLLIEFTCRSRARPAEACDGEISEKKTPAPQAGDAAEPAPGCDALPQDPTPPEDPMPAEQLVGVCGQWGGAQPALPFGSAAAATFAAPQFSGLASWAPMVAPSLSAQAPVTPRMPGWTSLAGVAPDSAGSSVDGCSQLRTSGGGSRGVSDWHCACTPAASGPKTRERSDGHSSRAPPSSGSGHCRGTGDSGGSGCDSSTGDGHSSPSARSVETA